MKFLTPFKDVITKELITIPLHSLNNGINDYKDYFIKTNNNKVEYVINKVCDHAGGRLIKKEGKAICPMHGWSLDLNNLQYNDSHNCKATIDFTINNDAIEFYGEKKYIVNPLKQTSHNPEKLTFRWLNHSTIYFEYNGTSIITDPWLFGPAFMTGWWLASPSPEESIDLLKKADFVYISHNHPDHLHAETLACLDKNTKFIVANFQSKSTEKYLNFLGFRNIFSLDFLKIHELGPDFQISILKSGDFRDDSGIYLCINGYEFILTVDCNFLNGHNLPKNIDFLMTSFAGVASGFPLCFEDYDEDEKATIIKRNRGSIKYGVSQYMEFCKPKYYMPYAGMFKEYSQRDSYIAENNPKNTPLDYLEISNTFNVKFIQPDCKKLYKIINDDILIDEVETVLFERENPDFYINTLKSEYKLDDEKIVEYFRKSNFSDNLIIQVVPTNDTFEPFETFISANFFSNSFSILPVQNIVNNHPSLKVSTFYVRTEVLMCVIENSLPWEDLLIGFQMRVKRSPNTYESRFWYHFTNVYINHANFRYSSFCGACTVINQNPIWQKKSILTQ